jgi:hypothetical protein
MGLLNRKKNGDLVIDLTVAERASAPIVWGSPAACPDCGGPGYLDHIDPYREVMFQHCTELDCGAKWQISRADVDAHASA